MGAAYVSEIVSPLVDGPNLAAAIAEVDVFALCKRFLPLVIAVCLACTGIYAVIGFGLDASGDAGASTAAILSGLEGSFNIGPVTLIPLVVMVVCIAFQVPAIPSFLAGTAVGAIEAVFYQGGDASMLLGAMVRGAESNTGAQFIDTLLSTGGINEMLETISIILLVMAYAGIMQHCGLMASMVEPIARRLKNFVALAGATVFSGALFNVLLPDQYPAITMSTLVYRDEYNRRGVDRAAWGNEFLGGHYVSACAVEHLLHLHGHDSGRFLHRLRGVRLLLLFVPNRRFRCGRAFRQEAWVGFER